MEPQNMKIATLSLAGYQLRGITLEDEPSVMSIINSFSKHYTGANETDQSELHNFLTNPEVNLAEDIRLLVSPEGKAVGYSECIMMDNPPVHPSVYVRMLPEFVDSEVPDLLMAWADQRAMLALERCPPELRVSVHSFVVMQGVPIANLLKKYGYGLIRHGFQMEINLDQPIPAPAWPAGIELRPFVEVEHLPAIYKAYDESFSDHYGHVDRPFEVGLKRFRHMLIEDEAHESALWFVAWDGDQVAGFSLCYKHSSEAVNMGWLGLLGVPRAWRKRGLGKALLLHTFEEFRKRGKQRVGLGVDASNLTGALRLYEGAGMHVARQWDRYEKELRPGKELMTTELSE